MLRSRFIKPGIVSNEELCALGPHAYILFTGLWMLADREGRLEDRPKRIKAMVMPLWDEVPWQAVDNLLDKLSESRFIHRYDVGGTRYIQITKWHLHQRPHQRETRSEIPRPIAVIPSESTTSDGDTPGHNLGDASTSPRRPRTRTRTRYKSGGGTPPSDVEAAPVENSPPPSQRTPERKQPASERRARPVGDDGPQEAPPRPRAPDRSPHTPEEVGLMRESLDKLAREIRMPPPDDQIVMRVLDAGCGASAIDIHETLVLLWRRNKFREMRSWGLLPVILADRFGRQSTVPASA